MKRPHSPSEGLVPVSQKCAAVLDVKQRLALDEQGYVVLEDILNPTDVARLRGLCIDIEARERAAGGARSTWPKIRQVRSLLNRDPAFERCVQHRRVLAAIEHLLGDDCRYLASTASIVEAGAPHHGLHVDYPLDRLPPGGPPRLASCVWLLDEFGEVNGATCCVPGSHRRTDALPQPGQLYEGVVAVRGRKGSVIVLNSGLWHGTCANRTRADRVGLLTYYHSAALDMAPFPGKTEPASEEVRARATPRMRVLLGMPPV